MELTIHQGADTIGGNCVEVRHGRTRLLLDAGVPLPDSPEETPPVVVPRTLDLSPPFDALLLSHAHCDHFGLMERLKPLPPVWLSKGTSQMLNALRAFARTGPDFKAVAHTLKEMRPIRLGDFTVTPIPVDHSVHGALAFLLEAGGKRLLYTGDLRTHGRNREPLKPLFQAMGASPPDAVITEGTTLDREPMEQRTEQDLEQGLTGDLKACSGLALASFSAVNVDRFRTWIEASHAAGRILVLDPYAAYVLHILRCEGLPALTDARFRTLSLPVREFSQSKPNQTWRDLYDRQRLPPEELRQNPTRYAVVWRDRYLKDLFGDRMPAGSLRFYGYWHGYRKQLRGKEVEQSLEAAGIKTCAAHVGGHINAESLKALLQRLNPARIIPIHTRAAGLLEAEFANCVVLKNGEHLTL
jgi:ribonuclease J